ncbi:MAG: Mrp/NBP35 family ATP-binding protein [Anaerolineae bacterium]|nr:Mrp/NBP35 family ATP-binding protein [Anaerolineae bacterium]
MATVEQVYEALRGVMDPELGRNIVDLGMVRDVEVKGDRVRFTMALTTLACPLKDRMVADAKKALLALEGVRDVDVKLTEMSAEEKARLAGGTSQREGSAEALNRIDHVVAVMSGKGGVGKSLVSGLLAVALRRAGYRVGVLDADVTGPSIPKMFFPDGARPGATPVAILPAESRTGIEVMSINLLLEREDEAVIWRGPLISNAIRQFWGDVLWGVLDYLVVDLPPGTSDAALTVMQTLPLSGVVLVTSPQGLAGMIVRKAARMAERLEVPILGLVENMSYFVCPETGTRYDIFGPSHAAELAAQFDIPFLGRLPIDPKITELCDEGHIEDYPAEEFKPIAEVIARTAPAAKPPAHPLRTQQSRRGK